MEIPSFGADFIGASFAFQQRVQAENVQFAVAKKTMEISKTQNANLLQILNPAHLGQNVDLRG